MSAKARGVTLVETTIAMAILAIATTGVLMTVVTNTQVMESNREFTAAAVAANKTLMEMQSSGDFKDIFRRYNAGAADDHPDGFNPGDSFDVPGADDALEPAAGEAHCGRVAFPLKNNLLCENVVDPNLNLPLDFNGDDKLDDDSRAGDYKVLPVAIVVKWKGFDQRDHAYELRTILTGK